MRARPHSIQFYPTLRCNRSCDFCFNRSLPQTPDMAPVDFKRMLAKLAGAGVTTLDIIGGEPTLHPDIVRLVADARASGFLVNLSSNGSDRPTLAKLMESGEGVAVGISVNDHETLELMSGFIAEYKPVVKSVYSRFFDRTLLQKVLLLKPRKYYLIYRDALEQGDLQDTVPFPRYKQAMEGFEEERVGSVYCSGFVPDVAVHPELARVRCPAGTLKLGVMPDGSVYPCNLLFGMEQFRLGNIISDPFEKIWNHDQLTFFRSFTQNQCPRGTCALHAECHGGCPAQGLLLGQGIRQIDPRCSEQ